MFYSSSFIIIQVDNIICMEDILKKTYFTEKNTNKDDITYFSIDFYDDEKSLGEMNWSYSFQFGKMNKVEFYRIDNKFVLFTSALENSEIFRKILEEMCNTNIDINILKIPLNFTTDNFNLNEEAKIESFNNFGLNILLSSKDSYNMLKIFTNGLVTYSMTNDETLLKKIICLTLEILEKNLKNIE
ncbi:hypothetical protein [Planococcus koreensis]|uniref:hypothetical protein n=1 Tax=Planococcus koreensis TaxID=112331 RepID=UPI0039FCD432